MAKDGKKPAAKVEKGRKAYYEQYAKANKERRTLNKQCNRVGAQIDTLLAISEGKRTSKQRQQLADLSGVRDALETATRQAATERALAKQNAKRAKSGLPALPAAQAVAAAAAGAAGVAGMEIDDSDDDSYAWKKCSPTPAEKQRTEW